MLKVRLIVVGKDKDEWVRAGCAHFGKLLSRWAHVEWKVLPGAKKASSLSPSELRKREGLRIIKELGKGTTIALDKSGEHCDSLGFARMLDDLQTTSGGVVWFVIGGPYGLDEAVLSHVDRIVSLSSLTLSHQLVRLVILEQLYRGFSILHGTDYHK